MIYDRADKAIKNLNKRNQKAFGKLKLAKFDELNVIRDVDRLYERSTQECMREYAEIAFWSFVESYLIASYLMNLRRSKRKSGGNTNESESKPDIEGEESTDNPSDNPDNPDNLSNRGTDGKPLSRSELKRKAEELAEDSITNDWILDMLEEYNPVTLYRFLPEKERKKQRLTEAVIASQKRNSEIDKALRYWTLQVDQYCLEATDKATIEAYKQADVHYVRWVTKDDERVCEDCAERDGMVFPINRIPDKPHYGCRCQLEPVS